MKQIPPTPFVTYVKKYSVFTDIALKAYLVDLKEEVEIAEDEYEEIARLHAVKYERAAWIKLRNLKAELGILEIIINIRSFEESLELPRHK